MVKIFFFQKMSAHYDKTLEEHLHLGHKICGHKFIKISLNYLRNSQTK